MDSIKVDLNKAFADLSMDIELGYGQSGGGNYIIISARKDNDIYIYPVLAHRYAKERATIINEIKQYYEK